VLVQINNIAEGIKPLVVRSKVRFLGAAAR